MLTLETINLTQRVFRNFMKDPVLTQITLYGEDGKKVWIGWEQAIPRELRSRLWTREVEVELEKLQDL